jgi:tetratricopeptide (TPR) repeat protein
MPSVRHTGCPPEIAQPTRELASVLLQRGNLDEAEVFAREAHSQGRQNAYLIDMLIAVLINKLGRRATTDPEVRQLFDLLHEIEPASRSFYATRRAELEYLWGDNHTAIRLIEEAVEETPKIFEPRRIYAEILLRGGNKVKAAEAIEWLRERVNSRDPSERRTNYRSYLVTNAHYLTEVGDFEAAKAIYEDRLVFSEKERVHGTREIEIVQGYKDQR